MSAARLALTPWEEGDTPDAVRPGRDWLGSITPGQARGLLVTRIPAELNSALESLYGIASREIEAPREATDAVRRAIAASDLRVKRFLIMACVAVSEDARRMLRGNCPAYRFDPWVSRLRGEFEIFLIGGN